MYQTTNNDQPPKYNESQPIITAQPNVQYPQIPPPTGYQQMGAVVNQPQQAPPPGMMVTGLDGHRLWSTDLFDCFDDARSCLFTCFCYPCAVCSVASRVGEFVCVPVCVPAGDIILRNRIRSIGGIRGSICNDCIVIAFCGMCATCQEIRELDNMGIP